jgi:hypothetical protein
VKPWCDLIGDTSTERSTPFASSAGWSFSISALALTAVDYIRTKRPLHRNRITFWLITLLLTQLGEGLTLIPPRWIPADRPRRPPVRRHHGELCHHSYHLPNLRSIVRGVSAGYC